MAKILVVDSNAEFAAEMRKQMARGGVDTICASSSREGIQAFVRHIPDGVILRDTLTDLSCWENAQLIRAISDAPIIFISEQPDRLARNRALQLGDEYMTSPWRWEYFVARLNALLKRSAQDCRTAPLLYDDGYLRVDIHNQLLTRAGRPVDLTDTEFRLLSCFVRYPNRALTYGDILQSVWGHRYLKAKSDVSLYVRHLRQKIEADVTRPAYLQTVRGIGYIFAAQP